MSEQPLTISDVRPEVQAFALAMEQRLRENDHKPGWKHENALDLYDELDDAHTMLDEYLGFDGTQANVIEASSEAVNSGNYSMMIWYVLQTETTTDTLVDVPAKVTVPTTDSLPVFIDGREYRRVLPSPSPTLHFPNHPLALRTAQETGRHLAEDILRVTDGREWFFVVVETPPWETDRTARERGLRSVKLLQADGNWAEYRSPAATTSPNS